MFQKMGPSLGCGQVLVEVTLSSLPFSSTAAIYRLDLLLEFDRARRASGVQMANDALRLVRNSQSRGVGATKHAI